MTHWLRDEYHPYRRVTEEDARENRRDWVAQLFSVGDGRLLVPLSPAQPVEDACVVVLRGHPAEVVAVVVLTEFEDFRANARFAVFRPAQQPLRAGSTQDVQEASYVLTDYDRYWAEIQSSLPRDCFLLAPGSWQQVDMTPFAGHPADQARPKSVSPQAQATEPADLPAALAVLASIKTAYADYELDHRRVLAAPALTDVDEETTAAFITAFAEARALEPEVPDRCSAARAVAFADAVWRAERAWEVAEAHATELGTAGFDPEQRNKIRRARQALELALQPDTPAGDRENALAAAHRLLDGLVALPEPLEHKLARAIAAAPQRPQLTADD